MPSRGSLAGGVAVLLACSANAFLLPSSVTSRSRSVQLNSVQPQKEDAVREKIDAANTGPRSGPSLPSYQYTDEDLKIMQDLTKETPYVRFLAEKAVTVVDDFFISAKEAFTNPDPFEYRKQQDGAKKQTRERIVVLGTGWGAHAFLQSIDALKYEVVVVSPRNFMLFTPMLAASAVGTVEYQSITEPIRKVNPFADYLEATCTDIDPASKVITCQSVICEGTVCDIEEFSLNYDHLLVAVGAATNTYGIPGVKEHCYFLKQIADAVKMRRAIGNAFERANIPGLTDQQREQALTFVIVGAGPTGVELCAELRDFITEDVPKYYPHLLKFVRIKLVEATDRVLSMFDEALQAEAVRRLTETPAKLEEEGLVAKGFTEVLLKVGVKEVGPREIQLSDGSTLPYGLCVWAAGNGPLPLVLDLIERVPDQVEKKNFGRGRLVTDKWMRVKGAPGVLAIGDCCVIDDKPLPANAQAASQQGFYLGRLFTKNFNLTAPIPERVGPMVTPGELLSVGERREGGKGYATGFQFLNLGTLAYTGGDSALAQIAVDKAFIKSSGEAGFLLWRSIYLSKQVSWRNRVLVAIDWIKTRVFGRDITRTI